jgi:hypothetical protein
MAASTYAISSALVIEALFAMPFSTVPVRTSFTADEIDTIYNDLWAAGYVLHCTDIEDGEVVVPTVDRLREIGDVLHDICDGLLEPDEADARPRR